MENSEKYKIGDTKKSFFKLGTKPPFKKKIEEPKSKTDEMNQIIYY